MASSFQIRKRVLVFLDETGDHSLEKIDPDFPIFAIVGVIFNPEDYPDAVSRFNRFKLGYVAHEGIVLHSREIASREGDFVFLNNRDLREKFLDGISREIAATRMSIAAGVIKKLDLKRRYSDPFSPYDLAFSFVFEMVFQFACGIEADYVHFIAEARGRNEDEALKRTFEWLKRKDDPGVVRGFPRFIDEKRLDEIHVRLEFRKKQTNIIGHQIADLVVSPIARTALKGVPHPSLTYFRDKILDVKTFP